MDLDLEDQDLYCLHDWRMCTEKGDAGLNSPRFLEEGRTDGNWAKEPDKKKIGRSRNESKKRRNALLFNIRLAKHARAL
jgi:hypothetical protein